MLLTSKETYPLLGIGNITLEKNNIKVNAFLSGKESVLKTYFEKNRKMAAYSKVYFIIGAPINEGDKYITPEILNNPQKRFSNISKYFGMSPLNSLAWYENLKKRYYTKTVSLGDILGRKTNITKSELTDNKNIQDANFIANIPIDEELYERVDLSQVHLHAFIQLDVKAMVDSGEIKRISRTLNSYIKVGGNLKSKKILEKKEAGLRTPDTKEVLTLEDGTPYNGKYTNVSGKGFFTAESGPSKKPLVVKKAVEKIVSANYLVEKSIPPTGNPTPEEANKKLAYSFSKPITEITKASITDTGIGNQLYYPKYLDNLKNTIAVQQIKNPNSSFITNAVHSVDTNGSQSHRIRFDFQWESLVKNKTKMGYLVDVANNAKHLNNLITVSTLTQDNFNSKSILDRVEIKEMCIKRVRLNNNPTTKTPVGTVKQEQTEDKKIILNITDYGFDKKYSDETASLEVMKQTVPSKTMIIRDFDLFNKPNSGRYSYVLEITLEDNNIKYFHSLLTNFRQMLRECDTLTQSIDYKPSVKKEIYNKGKSKDFTTDTEISIPRTIDMYMLFLCWFGKKYTKEEFLKVRSDLYTMASPEHGGTLSGLEKFREYSEIMAYNVEEMLKKTKQSPNTDMLVAKKGPKLPKKEALPLVNTVNIPGYSVAIEKEEILVSYPPAFTASVLSVSPDTTNRSALSVEPSEFLYKKKEVVSTIATKSQIATEKDIAKKENKLLILDNALKTSSTAAPIENKIKTDKPLLDLQEVYGIPGVTVAIPSSKGTFKSSDTLKKNISQSAEADAKASLGSTIKASITASTVNKTGISKIKRQAEEQKEQEELTLKRNSVLTKTMKVLSMVDNQETKHKIGAKKLNKIVASDNIEEKVFKDRSGELTIGIPSLSGEMIFKPLTVEAIEEIAEEEVVVRIEKPKKKTSKEKYKQVNNVYESTKTSLRNLLKLDR